MKRVTSGSRFLARQALTSASWRGRRITGRAHAKGRELVDGSIIDLEFVNYASGMPGV
jgi:hypothetical protein